MNKNKVREILIEAKNRISNPGTWAQGASARTVGGETCAYTSPYAFSFCITAALARASCDEDFNFSSSYHDAMSLLKKAIGITSSLSIWNDNANTRQSHVIYAFDRALDLLEKVSDAPCF